MMTLLSRLIGYISFITGLEVQRVGGALALDALLLFTCLPNLLVIVINASWDLVIFYAELIFGFIPDTYTVNENERWVTFNVSLVSGSLTREVIIDFFTQDGSGLGNR